MRCTGIYATPREDEARQSIRTFYDATSITLRKFPITGGNNQGSRTMTKFSHLDGEGKARMVDVTEKKKSPREAVARGKLVMHPHTVALIEAGSIPKGDVFTVAKIAAIMAAKKTSEIIPMCHPLELTGIDIRFHTNVKAGEISIEATVKNVGKTGVEMEAMTAVSVAALTIYDMCKSADKSIILTDIKLMSKRGGRSGVFVRKGEPVT